MLSIAKNIAELDRLVSARSDVLASYAETVRETAAHLPEIRREFLTPCQDGLRAAAMMIEGAREPEQWKEAGIAVRNALARFRDETTKFVQSLQSNLASTSAMLQRLMGQVSSMGGDQHQGLQGDLGHLREVVRMDDLAGIRRVVLETTDRMTARLDELKREQSLVVAQLQEEIQILHRQLTERANGSRPAPAAPVAPSAHSPVASGPSASTESPAPSPEPAPEPAVPNGMRREEFAAALKLKADQGENFSVSIFWLSNLAQLFTRHEPDLVIEMMNLATARIRESVLDNPLWTRWEDDCFAICTNETKAQAARSSQALTAHISGDYAVPLHGETTRLPLRVVVGVVERAKDEPAEKTMARVSQMAKSLRSMA